MCLPADNVEICATVKRHKGCGEDGIPGDVLATASDIYGRIIHPVLLQRRCALKSHSSGIGAALQEVHKPRHEVREFRDVWLCDDSGTAYHR